MKMYRVTATALIELTLEVEANSRIEAMVKAENMRKDFEQAARDGTITNIELTGARLV